MCENDGLLEDIPVRDYSDDDDYESEDEDDTWGD